MCPGLLPFSLCFLLMLSHSFLLAFTSSQWINILICLFFLVKQLVPLPSLLHSYIFLLWIFIHTMKSLAEVCLFLMRAHDTTFAMPPLVFLLITDKINTEELSTDKFNTYKLNTDT